MLLHSPFGIACSSSAGTPWGSSSTSSAQISLKTRFYRKDCWYLFLGLEISNLLTKFYQNCLQVLRSFFKYKIPMCRFFCQHQPKGRSHKHNKSSRTLQLFSTTKNLHSQVYSFILAKKPAQKKFLVWRRCKFIKSKSFRVLWLLWRKQLQY